jgi:hypothetical protein
LNIFFGVINLYLNSAFNVINFTRYFIFNLNNLLIIRNHLILLILFTFIQHKIIKILLKLYTLQILLFLLVAAYVNIDASIQEYLFFDFEDEFDCFFVGMFNIIHIIFYRLLQSLLVIIIIKNLLDELIIFVIIINWNILMVFLRQYTVSIFINLSKTNQRLNHLDLKLQFIYLWQLFINLCLQFTIYTFKFVHSF